ncbi:uncharacterized protein LOC123898525 isoform X2 [Trifolium pratense]|uniref:uncharacterized protein LOC123898525 isoform X2 n=1 Tax=Trifolium pratense TaxID=57577 RepID=UPI001E69503B|nr:uncharacterized protein LOC123898525 isoform X2 [Trifolium pratense]
MVYDHFDRSHSPLPSSQHTFQFMWLLIEFTRNHRKHMCISMELVAAVLGDHGQRPHEDYVVATAVTELGNGKPKFYSTRDNLFLHKMAITNKSRVVVLNKGS